MAALMGPSGSGKTVSVTHAGVVGHPPALRVLRRRGRPATPAASPCSQAGTPPRPARCCTRPPARPPPRRLQTLLDLLAGRKTVGKTEGGILFAGLRPSQQFLRRYTGYVEQFDTLIPTLTVSEMLMYTAGEAGRRAAAGLRAGVGVVFWGGGRRQQQRPPRSVAVLGLAPQRR
jgi:hypothetical protein